MNARYFTHEWLKTYLLVWKLYSHDHITHFKFEQTIRCAYNHTQYQIEIDVHNLIGTLMDKHILHFGNQDTSYICCFITGIICIIVMKSNCLIWKLYWLPCTQIVSGISSSFMDIWDYDYVLSTMYIGKPYTEWLSAVVPAETHYMHVMHTQCP